TEAGASSGAPPPAVSIRTGRAMPAMPTQSSGRAERAASPATSGSGDGEEVVTGESGGGTVDSLTALRPALVQRCVAAPGGPPGRPQLPQRRHRPAERVRPLGCQRPQALAQHGLAQPAGPPQRGPWGRLQGGPKGQGGVEVPARQG